MNAQGYVGCIAGMILAACSGSDAPTSSVSEPPLTKVEDSVFGDMTNTMERAKSVDATGMQHKEEIDRAVEAQ